MTARMFLCGMSINYFSDSAGYVKVNAVYKVAVGVSRGQRPDLSFVSFRFVILDKEYEMRSPFLSFCCLILKAPIYCRVDRDTFPVAC